MTTSLLAPVCGVKLLGRDPAAGAPIFRANRSLAFEDSEVAEKLYIFPGELKLSLLILLGDTELRRRFADDEDA